MSDLEKTIKIIFGSDDKALKKSASEIESQFKSMDKVFSDITDPLAKAGSSLLKVDAALSALVVGGIALAVRESKNFNKEFALISTSVDATGADLDRYREQILQYSTTSTKSISDINAALYTAAQAGIKWGESLDFMGKAEQLAVANNANLNTTVDLLTGTMNAYGYSVKDVGHLNDVFFTSTLIGKQTIDDLGQSMGMVVGIAANFGVSFESLSAAISTLTAKGMETSEAITAVKGVITSIANPSKEAADAAKEMGLNFTVAELKANGLEGMLTKVMAATGGNADKMKILFGETRALNGVMQLTGDNMVFFNDALVKINNSTGSAETAYKKMADTFDNQSQMLINTAKTLMIEVGTRLEDTAAKYAGSLATMLAGITKAIDKGAFDGVFVILDSFANDFAKAIKKISESMPDALANIDMSKLIEAMRNAGDAISGVFGDAEAEDITRAVNDIIDTIASLISVTQGIVEVFVPIGAAVREAIAAFNSLDASTKQLIGNFMGFSMAYKFFGPISIALIALGADAETAGRIFTLFFASLENGFNLIKVLLYAVATGFFELITAGIKFLDLIPGLDFSKEIAQNEKTLDSLKGKLSDSADALMLSTAKVVDAWNGTGESADKATGKVSNYEKAINNLPDEKKTEIKADGADKSIEQINKIKDIVNTIPAQKDVNVEVRADGSSIEKAHGMIIETFQDGSIAISNIKVAPDIDSINKTKEKLEKEIPSEKMMEIQANVDIARIKELSGIIQSNIEWKAKIDITQIENQTERLKTMFESVNETIKSTGDTISSLADAMSGIDSSRQLDLIDFMREEMNMRREAMAMQKELVQAEIEEIKARTKLMNEGKDVGIKISADGLKPHLEAFMYEILNAIQVRATQDGVSFLIGAGGSI